MFGQFGAADVRTAAGAMDRNGLTRVGRALQKHAGREESAFNGMSSGNAIARNEHGMRVLDEILEDSGGTTHVLDNVTNIWDSTGRGIRLSNDGTFHGLPGAAAVIAGYRLLLASSVGDREGMAIELTRDDGTRVAEVFEDKNTGRRTVNVFESDVPLEAVEWLLTEARSRL